MDIASKTEDRLHQDHQVRGQETSSAVVALALVPGGRGLVQGEDGQLEPVFLPLLLLHHEYVQEDCQQELCCCST
jgi:hypothetical protein